MSVEACWFYNKKSLPLSPGVNLIELLQVKFTSLAIAFRTMVTLVNYTCKSFIKLTPGCQYNKTLTM